VPAWAQNYFAAEVRGERFAHAWIEKARTALASRTAIAAPPAGRRDLSGTFRTVVIAATYADRTPAFEPAQYDSLFFGPTGFRGGYSLRTWFEEASGGRFRIAGSVTGWIRLPRPWSYYLDNFSNNGRGRWTEYLRDALVSADSVVDWRQYDNDGADGVPNSGDDDGYVDMVMFLHPLADGVCRRDSLAGPVATGHYLGACGMTFTTRRTGASGRAILVDDFVLAAGLDCAGASNISTINIPAHEFGHALGLPDLNDLDRSTIGVGSWDVMGYGLYAAPGRPAGLGAWSRWQLGWGTTITANTAGSYVVPPAGVSRTALRVDLPGTREYFLVENRVRTGIDAGLPGSGLIVWHVDADSLARYAPLYKGTENDQHPGIAIVRAGGSGSETRDPFPGPLGITTLGRLTNPSSRTFDGAFTGLVLDSLGLVAPGGLSFVVRYEPRPAVADVTAVATAVVDQFLAGSLPAEQQEALDGLGNQNGELDLGDMVAWLDRQPGGLRE
jgi:M6 family metalloprotease-like protein